jgi:hypothetical protein
LMILLLLKIVRGGGRRLQRDLNLQRFFKFWCSFKAFLLLLRLLIIMSGNILVIMVVILHHVLLGLRLSNWWELNAVFWKI